MNALTGKYEDHLEMTNKSCLEVDKLENVQNISARNNCGNVLNSHGKLLLQLCKNFDLHILNGKKRRLIWKCNSETNLSLKKGAKIDFRSLEEFPIQYIWDKELYKHFHKH